MLIGCCHCDGHKDPPPPPSESVPPSESQSASSAGSNNYAYGICGCAVVPLVWEVVWPEMDVNAACPFAAGIYELPLLPGDCAWEGGPRGYRMQPVAGVWQCTSGIVPGNVPLSRSFFRLTANDPGGIINLRVQFGGWGPSGLGLESYISRSVNYAGPAGGPCIMNGALTSGGISNQWHDNRDTTFPYTYVPMPLPASITIRPKV